MKNKLIRFLRKYRRIKLNRDKKKMTSITFYGGLSTIGGNSVIIEENGTRIMLDNGMCFSKEGSYYKDFLQPRKNNDLRDYFELDLVPKIPGIYGKEQLYDGCIDNTTSDSEYLFECDLLSYEDYLQENGKPYVSALFLTHAHLDHVRNVMFMAPEIPIYCSRVTLELLRIIDDLSNYNFLEYYFSVKKERSGRATFPGHIYKENCRKRREIKIIEPYKVIKIPERNPIFKVRGFPVDHSIPGAMSFEILTKEEKIITYTGDIRFHGHDHEKIKSNSFLTKTASNPDALITEGTRINDDDDDLVDENDVYLRIRNFLKKDRNLSQKLIFTSFPWKSISRFLTVYNIAKELNRVLVIQPKLAYTIHHLQKIKSLRLNGILKEDLIKIYLPRKYGMIYSYDDYTSTKYHLSPFNEWSNDKSIKFYSDLYEEDIFVKAYEIKKNPNKYIVHLNFYKLNELIDIQPPEGSYFFNLKTEPFDEEGELEEKVLLNWLSKFGLEYKKDYYHASGHASGVQIKEMIDKINPKLIFPIHTEHPEAFNYKNAINKIGYGEKYQL